MHRVRIQSIQVTLAISLCASAVLSACGGGGGGGGSDGNVPATPSAVAAVEDTRSILSAENLAAASVQSSAVLPLDSNQSLPSVATETVHALAATAAIETTAATRTVGTTYFVDSQLGDDSFTGTVATTGVAGAGPWRTLAKLNRSGFAPGDTIRLACGSVWYETLRLNSSGTVGAPITVAAASSNCASPPRIDGSTTVQPASWVRHSGNIFRATLSKTSLTSNLLVNGDFALPNAAWAVWSPKGDATKQQVAACNKAACMKVTAVADTSLLSSNSFELKAATTYTVQYSLNAALGTNVRVFVRRATAPYDAVGYARVVSGNGGWQTVSTTFQSNAALPNARLDFEIPGSAATVQIAAASVVMPASIVTPTLLEPLNLATASVYLRAAHHPNQGYDTTQPTSVYLRNAIDSDRKTINGATVSTFVTSGADLTLPVGGSIPSGTKVRIRSNAWTIDERTVTGYSGSRLLLDTPSSYPINAGWGYFLLGQLWMLDSAGEWFYDKPSQTLYAWMPDSTTPLVAVMATYLPVGIDAAGRQYTIFDGISVRYAGVGVNMRSATGVTVRNLRIEDTAGLGIDAGGGADNILDGNVISRTGADAITGVDYGLPATVGMQITNNRIDQSGVLVAGNKLLSLPSSSAAAIRAGYQATVIGNTVVDSGWLGIWVVARSTVRDNYVKGACSVQDDCGGIYTNGVDNRSTIANNIVESSRGAIDGKPLASAFSQAQGIYLDFLTSNVTVSGNTVMYNDYGIQMHDAANNVIEGNKLYGNRLAQLWLQEQTTRTRATGDIYGNIIRANQFVPTSATSHGFKQQSEINSTTLFGTFDYNKYFDRIFPTVGFESAPTTTATEYAIGSWKAAVTSSGLARNQDVNGSGASQQLFTTYLISGGSIAPNGNLAIDTKGWASWNQTAPAGTLVRQPCIPGFCAVYTAGNSDGLLSTPNFSLTAGQWYRLSVDVLGSVNSQAVPLTVRRGGGGSNGYEDLGGGVKQVTASTGWQRVSFNFRAGKTVNANDPLTGDLGARLDFQQIKPGQRLTVSNVSLVPITTGAALTKVDILVNTSAAPVAAACPTAATNAAACAIFARLSDDTAIAWPYLVPARSSEVIYTRDARLADVDGDGIADGQDVCPGTPGATGVGADGCSFAQRH